MYADNPMSPLRTRRDYGNQASSSVLPDGECDLPAKLANRIAGFYDLERSSVPDGYANVPGNVEEVNVGSDKLANELMRIAGELRVGVDTLDSKDIKAIEGAAKPYVHKLEALRNKCVEVIKHVLPLADPFSRSVGAFVSINRLGVHLLHSIDASNGYKLRGPGNLVKFAELHEYQVSDVRATVDPSFKLTVEIMGHEWTFNNKYPSSSDFEKMFKMFSALTTPYGEPDQTPAVVEPVNGLDEIEKFMKQQSTWFTTDERDRKSLVMSSRKHGNVYAETVGNPDMNEGRRLARLVESKFGNNVSASVEAVDEWVILTITLK